MTRKRSRAAILLLLISGVFFLSTGLVAQVPEGGIRLNANTGTLYQQIGQCTASTVAVSDQDFTEAIHVEVGSSISNTWDAQLKFPAVDGIETNDVLFVAFYARTLSSPEETGEGSVTVVIENNSTYAKQISYKVTVGNEWKQYYASAVSAVDLTSSQVSYLFHIGYPDQVIEVADVQFLNYKQTISIDDLPETEITYIGQDPEASWRAPAAERIGQYRKGPVSFTILDESGAPIENADLSIEMVQHQFGFGTAVAANEFNDNETYRNKVLELFNEVVFENDLKWRQFNPASTDHISRALDTLDAHMIPVRGHNVIWPSWRFMPASMETLADNPEALSAAINNRFDDVTQYTSGRLNDWDVINEPYSEHDVMDILGDEVMADWFKHVKLNDRAVKLYLNEYGIISGGGKNTAKQDFYYNLLEQIDSWGGQVDGIGIQSHMSTELTSINKVYEILERFGSLGKDIKITEHDIAMDQRAVQADYTRDFLTICFSHPAVKSVLIWGFWEGRHWEPEAALFDNDWTIRPHGEMWSEMIYNQWWTPETLLNSDVNGEASSEGFLGRYKYTLSYGEGTRSGYFEIKNSNASGEGNEIVLSLDEAIPEKVEITSSIEGFLCEGESAVLQAPEGDGLSYTWYLDDVEQTETSASLLVSQAGTYKVEVNKNGLSIASDPYDVFYHSTPLADLSFTGDTSLCDGELLSLDFVVEDGVDYFWMKNGSYFTDEAGTLEIDAAGIYKLKAVAEACENESETVTVALASSPEASITVTGDLPLCEGELVYLMGTISTGLTYNWFRDNEELGYTERLLESGTAGTYHVDISNGDCTSSSERVVVEVNSNPEATITTDGELTFCPGSSVNLEANEGDGLTYTWMNGSSILEASERILEADEAGSYSLTTTLDGCSTTSDPITVTVLSESDPECDTYVIQEEGKLRFYPNPFRESFIIECSPEQEAGSRAELYSILGEQIMVKDLSNNQGKVIMQVNTPGIYLLKIVKGTKVETHRLVAE